MKIKPCVQAGLDYVMFNSKIPLPSFALVLPLKKKQQQIMLRFSYATLPHSFYSDTDVPLCNLQALHNTFLKETHFKEFLS